jgi:hypothetical protein
MAWIHGKACGFFLPALTDALVVAASEAQSSEIERHRLVGGEPSLLLPNSWPACNDVSTPQPKGERNASDSEGDSNKPVSPLRYWAHHGG